MSDMTAMFNEAVTSEYRKAVARLGNLTTAASKLNAMAFAAEALRNRIHAGELELPLDDALHAALQAADAKDGQTADGILGRLARGELGLDLWPDPLLEVVVILGRGRRKAWKHVTADDLSDMAELRNQNTKAARKTERRFIKDVETVYADLITAGSVGAMVEANRAAARDRSA